MREKKPNLFEGTDNHLSLWDFSVAINSQTTDESVSKYKISL